MHDGLAGSLSEGIVEIGTMVLSQVVPRKRLTTVLVDTLKNLRRRKREIVSRLSDWHKPGTTNLVTSGISQTGEKRGELATGGGSGVILEDDLVESTSGSDLGGD